MHDRFTGDALSGADGTQGPGPFRAFPDALAGAAEPLSAGPVGGRDRFALPMLPPAPDAGAIQEAIDAALSDEPAGARPVAPARPPPAQHRRPPPPMPAPAQQTWQPPGPARQTWQPPHGPAPARQTWQQPPGAPMRRQDPRMFAQPTAGLQRRPPPAPYAPPQRPAAPYVAAAPRRKVGIGCLLLLVFAALVVFTVLAQAVNGVS